MSDKMPLNIVGVPRVHSRFASAAGERLLQLLIVAQTDSQPFFTIMQSAKAGLVCSEQCAM